MLLCCIILPFPFHLNWKSLSGAYTVSLPKDQVSQLLLQMFGQRHLLSPICVYIHVKAAEKCQNRKAITTSEPSVTRFYLPQTSLRLRLVCELSCAMLGSSCCSQPRTGTAGWGCGAVLWLPISACWPCLPSTVTEGGPKCSSGDFFMPACFRGTCKSAV